MTNYGITELQKISKLWSPVDPKSELEMMPFLPFSQSMGN